MKESRLTRGGRDRQGHLSPDSEKLVAGALGLSNSGSRFEDDFWEGMLAARLEKMLENGHNQGIFDAIERLNQTDLEAYGALVEAVENAAESMTIEHEGIAWDVVLVIAPVVAWTRYKIGSGPIVASKLAQFEQGLKQEVLAKQAKLSLAPYFFSVDQLPREFSELRKLTKRLGQAAITGATVKHDSKSMPETAEMLADSRYLLGAVATPSAQALFRWQELDTPAHVSRVATLERWINSARPQFETLLPGCGFECLLPDAYHINLRESDRRVRPHGIRAGVNFLTETLEVPAEKLRAYVAGFGNGQQLDEYRIGLSIGDSEEVAQGIVWPLFGPESLSSDQETSYDPIAIIEMNQGELGEQSTQLEQIKSLLREVGIKEIRVWPNMEDPEFCEDCGAPMYPNIKGDIVHAELPDDVDAPNHQLH
jgi:hypothetical protein